MNQNSILSVLSKVNAPYAQQFDGPMLANALISGDIRVAQVASFFTEVSQKNQTDFAFAFGVPEYTLSKTASAFFEWSGYRYPDTQ